MSMFSAVMQKLKEVLNKMLGKQTIQSALHLTPIISNEMERRIDLWDKMYKNQAPWLKPKDEGDPSSIESLGLASMIASEKARTALLEFQSEITAPMETTEDVATEDNLQEGENEIDKTEDETNNSFDTEAFHPKATVKKEKPKGNTQRADYLNKQYIKLKRNLRRELEYGIAKGGIVIKPYVVLNKDITPTFVDSNENVDKDGENAKSNLNTTSNLGQGSKNNTNVNSKESEVNTEVTTAPSNTFKPTIPLDKAEIEFEWVQADDFYPLAFDGSGKVTEAAFIQRKVDKDSVYSRLEYHKYENHKVTIVNKAYKSTNVSYNQYNSIGNDLGQEIPLTSVPEWSDFQPTTTIAGVDRLLFAYFRMPEANTIDTYSPLGVSGYDRAIGLIRQADIQYSRLLWEYEGSELAIDIDRDALRDDDVLGGSMNPILQQRLFRKVDLGNDSDTYKVFSPQIRDASLINGLNTILMRIEDVTGISRGTISNVNSSEAKTATELKILKQRSYQTNAEIQEALQIALEDTIYIMNVLCSLYNITPEGEYETSFEWDDSILVDVEAELGKRMTLLNSGLAGKVETRMWYFGETENQAKTALAKIQEENRDAVAENIDIQASFGGDFGARNKFNAENSKSAKFHENEDNKKIQDKFRDKQPNGKSEFDIKK